MTMMYHAQERIVTCLVRKLPNSVVVSITRSPYHAETDAYDRRLCPSGIRLYYYGTVGSNRDEFVVVRKMKTLTG